MEKRELLAVTVAALTSNEGTAISGTVATFLNTDVTGAPTSASIAWGDGQVTSGTIAASGASYSVSGLKTYPVPGTFPVVVTIQGDPGTTAVVGQGKATVNAIDPIITAKSIAVVVGQPFTGPVASFTDAYPGLNASSYTAIIKWDINGPTTIGTVQPIASGGYDVIGTNTYPAGASTSKTLTVSVIRNVDGKTVSTSASPGSATVTNTSNLLTGGLAPSTDTGAIDGVTAINQPTFVGTASVYSIVTVYVRRIDQAQPVALGQAVTTNDGVWTFTTGALPDGTYEVAATETPTAGQPGPLTPLSPGGRLVIDTTPPVAVSAAYDRNSGQIRLVLRDSQTAFDDGSLLNTANYALMFSGRFRSRPLEVTRLATAAVRASDSVTILLRLDPAAKGWASRRGASVALGMVTDLAGNPLRNRQLKLTVLPRTMMRPLRPASSKR